MFHPVWEWSAVVPVLCFVSEAVDGVLFVEFKRIRKMVLYIDGVLIAGSVLLVGSLGGEMGVLLVCPIVE